MNITHANIVNPVFALAAPQQDAQTQQLRQLDATVRSDAARRAASAGAGATATTDIKYELGPDGKLYAVGGTVTTSRRVQGTAEELRDVRSGAIDPSQLRGGRRATDPANDNRDDPARPVSFADLAAPTFNLSPLEFAQLQEEQQRDDSLKEQFVSRLRATDLNVRTHEAQHFFVGAGLTQGTPEYDYVEGPDGRFYAVAGEVNLSTSGSSDPEQAAREADSLTRAANAPADSSAQDISVARSSGADAAALYSRALAANNPPVVNLVG